MVRLSPTTPTTMQTTTTDTSAPSGSTTTTTVKAPRAHKPKTTSSKLRLHKGNMPVLPQTKQCTLCNAKFTRTTHLTRHLRSHSNERLYSCDLCKAEFTRSDLLTRHQRSCGDPNASRSRRTSCEACAKSKIKCDLEQPCSKCVSRGRECVYINDPLATKAKQSKQPTSQSSPSTSDAISSDNQPSYRETPPALVEDNGSLSPASSFHSALSPQSESSVTHIIEVHDPEALSVDASANGFNFDPSTVSLDFFYSQTDNCAQAPVCQDAEPVNIDTFGQMDYLSMTPSIPYSTTNSTPSPVVPTAIFPATSFPPQPTTAFPPPPQEQEANLFSSNWTQHCPPGNNEQTTKTFIPKGLSMCQEKSRYFDLFFTSYLPHYPFLHQATWSPYGKPWILLKAMQACGAMYASDDSGGTRFVRDTLSFMKDVVVWEFARTTDPMERDTIILAGGLLLTICAFDQVHDEFFKAYYDTLVSMIRQAGVIERVGRGWDATSIAVSEVKDSAGKKEELDKMWKAWSHYETMKRVLLLAYISDYTLPPSFDPNEFSVNLACETALFVAPTSVDWYNEILKAPLSGPKSNGPGGLGANVQMAVRMLNLTGGGIGEGLNPDAGPGTSDMMECVKEMSPCSRGVLARTVQILVWIGGVQMSMGISSSMMGSMMGSMINSGNTAVSPFAGSSMSSQQHTKQPEDSEQGNNQLIPVSQMQYSDIQMNELEALFSNSAGGTMGNMVGVI